MIEYTLDITERRMMEEELLKAQKLESVGFLAGGIAHDFNNILTSILGNIEIAKMGLYQDNKITERLTKAEKATLQAKNLTQQLLTFSKGGVPVKKVVSVSELLRESANFALRGSNVRVKFSSPDNLWSVEVDEGQVSQVISNLIINADQAMPKGGIIELFAENVTAAAEDSLPLKNGKYVKISIKDHGTGISEEHLPKIFDPFFTTKKKGSGLGLATSYSIVKKHGGCITAESQLGAGTTFSIYVPATKKKIPEQGYSKERILFGKGRVLVMDDEEPIRELVAQMLSHCGYEVTTVKDGVEAMELYKKERDNGRPFDVVIMDLTIPGGMGGKEATQRLLEIDPGVKVIVSSGYSNDPIMADYKKYGFCGVIAKPYRIKELSEVLKKVITGKNE
ncbi:Sensor kinase CckA [subsurface metagenome]